MWHQPSYWYWKWLSYLFICLFIFLPGNQFNHRHINLSFNLPSFTVFTSEALRHARQWPPCRTAVLCVWLCWGLVLITWRRVLMVWHCWLAFHSSLAAVQSESSKCDGCLFGHGGVWAAHWTGTKTPNHRLTSTQTCTHAHRQTRTHQGIGRQFI